LYFPDQIVKLARMYQRFSIRTRLEYKPSAASSVAFNMKIAHVNDPTCIYSYGSFTLNSTPPNAAFDAQSHMNETVLWRGMKVPQSGYFGPPTRELMKYTSFPNVVGVPDTPFTYTDADVDEKVTWSYTPQSADIRDSVAGSYWITSDIAPGDIGGRGYGVFFLYYELILCDMTTSSAGYTPQFAIDVSTIDLGTAKSIPIPEGHQLGKHLHKNYSGSTREVKGSRRPNTHKAIPILKLPKCEECGYYKIGGRCICDVFDGLTLEEKQQEIHPEETKTHASETKTVQITEPLTDAEVEEATELDDAVLPCGKVPVLERIVHWRSRLGLPDLTRAEYMVRRFETPTDQLVLERKALATLALSKAGVKTKKSSSQK